MSRTLITAALLTASTLVASTASAQFGGSCSSGGPAFGPSFGPVSGPSFGGPEPAFFSGPTGFSPIGPGPSDPFRRTAGFGSPGRGSRPPAFRPSPGFREGGRMLSVGTPLPGGFDPRQPRGVETTRIERTDENGRETTIHTRHADGTTSVRQTRVGVPVYTTGGGADLASFGGPRRPGFGGPVLAP